MGKIKASDWLDHESLRRRWSCKDGAGVGVKMAIGLSRMFLLSLLAGMN